MIAVVLPDVNPQAGVIHVRFTQSALILCTAAISNRGNGRI